MGSLERSITFTLGIEPRMRSTKTSVLFCLVATHLSWDSLTERHLSGGLFSRLSG